jgi:hypothetical protein
MLPFFLTRFCSCNINKWPDDFDFEATRAINKPVIRESSPADLQDVKDEAEAAAKPASIAGDSFDAREEEDELDPVALNKAFRFASWSSVGLVSHRLLIFFFFSSSEFI